MRWSDSVAASDAGPIVRVWRLRRQASREAVTGSKWLTHMNTCPSLDELQKLLANDLAGARGEELETHIDLCDACQRVLEQLTDATGLNPIRPGRSPAPADTPATLLCAQDAPVATSATAFLRDLGQSPPSGALPLRDDDTAPRGGALSSL